MARQYPSGFFIVTNETGTRQYPQGGGVVADETTSSGSNVTLALSAASATAQAASGTPTVQPAFSATIGTGQATGLSATVAFQPGAGSGTGTAGQFGLPLTGAGAFAGGSRIKQRFPDFWLPKRKPVGDVEIDRANRLVGRGLAAFWAAGFNQDATGIRDLMNYAPTLTATGTGATIGVTSGGQVGAITGGTSYFSAPYLTNYQNISPTSKLTLAMRACFSGTPPQGDLFALDLNGAPNYSWGIGINGAGQLAVFYNNGSFQTIAAASAFTPVAGQVYAFAAVLDGVNVTLYQDGAVIAGPTAQASGNITYPTAGGPFIDTGAVLSGAPTVQLDWAAFWPTVLTQAEIASLVHDPYQMLRPIAKRQFVTNTSSNATVALTAATANAQVATVGTQVSVQPPAVNGSAQTGNLTKTVSLAPAVTTATGQTGALAVNISSTVALPAATTTGSIGSFTKTIAITPAAGNATGQAGTPTKAIQVQAAAAAATAQTGAVTPVAGQVVNLSAATATGNAGLFAFSLARACPGANALASAGTFGIVIINPHPVGVVASIDAVLLSTRGAPSSRTAFIE